jgi:hypothetical protein
VDVGRDARRIVERADRATLQAEQRKMVWTLPLVPVTGVGSTSPERRSSRSVSMTALTAKALPERRRHSVQWQA